MAHKRKTELLRETVTELTRQWEVLDKTLSDVRIQHLLETRSRERTQLEKKQAEIEEERRRIERELQQRAIEYEAAWRQEQIPTPEETAPERKEGFTPSKNMLRCYMDWLYGQCGRLSLGGIDRKAAGPPQKGQLHLDSIYTALLTTGSIQKEPEKEKPEELEKAERETRQLSALEQVNRYERLVLLGEPGSGKSTFINFVAMCLAGQWLTELEEEEKNLADLKLLRAPLPTDSKEKTEQEWEHWPLVPVRVILRDFAARALPRQEEEATAEHLWVFLQKELEEAALPEFGPYLREFLQEKGGILFFDGLDEVPEAEDRRKQITRVVEDCAGAFPRCRIVVTSRTYAYQKQEWRLGNFRESVLANFSKSQVRYFIEHWYRHIGPLRGMAKKKIAAETKRLQDAIFSSPRLSSFAERPLLLTLMASLHAWRGGSLPEKREELYNDAVDLLLDWWESRKLDRKESLSDLLQVSKDSLRRTLNALALDAHKSQPDLAGTADIAEKDLVSRLMHLSYNNKLDVTSLMTYLSERSGLLVPRGVGVYTFPHRTFQEYLAACALTDSVDFPDNVAELGRREPIRWREVVLLAAAKAARGAASSVWMLAEALCFQDPPAKTEDAWGALLAGQILQESANLKALPPRQQPKLERIRRWLVAILTEQAPEKEPLPAVERALAGRLLAQIGDPRPGVGLWEDGLPDIEWCDVPEGTFLMGSDPEHDPKAFDWEYPQHEVRLFAYQISRYPVTQAQYRSFIKAGGYNDERWWRQDGWKWKERSNIRGPEEFSDAFLLSNDPVVGVSWYEAVAFCVWLTVKSRERGGLSEREVIRLPSEAEWERAARGEGGQIYPWGNEPIQKELANYIETGIGKTSAVGSFPRGRSPYGCEEMGGNVWEWCRDWFDLDYYKQSPQENPKGPASGSDRVVRGGAWNGVAGYCRATYRGDWPPAGHLNLVGFRLVKTTAD